MTTDILFSKQLRTIVVDLTPLLPGGDNGGAKVFVLELLRRLGELAPQTEFVLLTQASAHEELAILDGPNMRRMMIFDRSNLPFIHTLAGKTLTRFLRHLPGRLRRVAGRVGYRLMAKIKQTGSGSLLRDLNADLLFCPFTAPTYCELNVPTVCVIYDLQYKKYPEFFDPEDVIIRDRSFVEAARQATMLVAISEYTRRAAIAAANLAPERIKTIHLHVSRFSLRDAERDDAVLARLGLAERKYVVYPANFWKHKNHEMLLTAFGIATRNGLADDVRLVCTGAPGARQAFLQQASRALGLENRILFPGYISHAELVSLIANSAGIIFPSLYEGFGLPVIEAMALGVPVACSNVTSLPEVAGDAAILFDPRKPEDVASALVTLANDHEKQLMLIKAGDARAVNFSDSRLLARKFWNVFEQVIGADKQSSVLLGVKFDGWIGPMLRLQIAASSTPQTLELAIFVPLGVPMSRVSLAWQVNNVVQGAQTIDRGQRLSISITLPMIGGSCVISFTPTFVPLLTGFGDDARELSAVLEHCCLVSKNETTVLFPNQMPA